MGFGEGRRWKRRKSKGGRVRGLVQMKVEKLRKLVPGGTELELDGLCDQTAEYIHHLKLQVCLLEAILNSVHNP